MDKQLDAIGIGCRRCASSFLHDCLNQHPEIVKPNRGLHFFSEFATQGLDWYFDNLPVNSDKAVLLEFSVSYTYPEFTHLAAKRINEIFSDVKLFVSVRNPVDRAFSDYLRSIRNLEIPHTQSFAQAIETHPEFLERGRYSLVLAPYFELFPSKQIHVLIYEDLLESTERFLRPLFRFLGVNENYAPEGINTKNRERGGLRWPILQSSLLGAKQVLDQSAKILNCLEFWTKVKEKYRRNYLFVRSINTANEKMTDSIKKHLRFYYKQDVAWIRETTGRNLYGWD
jgi:hypothetical protein